jgi:hypothetical protein
MRLPNKGEMMPKIIELEVTVEQSTTILVTVPDDTPLNNLYRHNYGDAIRKAIREQDPEWETDDYFCHSLDVQSIKEVTEDEADDYEVTDICAEIEAAKLDEQKKKEEYEASKKAEGA